MGNLNCVNSPDPSIEKDENKKTTIYERIGGESALDAFVEIFYKKILSDDKINDFFKNTDINQQKNHQKRFLIFAFGGSNKYNGRTIFAAHKTARDQGLNEDHFNAVADHLVATLKELDVEQADIDEIVEIALSVKDDVLGTNKKNEEEKKEEEAKKTTVFQRIGGEPALDGFVEIFYKKILADDTINRFFKNTDINQQKNHQKRFLMFAFGGANKYNGRTIFAAHKAARDQGLNEDHFNAVAGHLVATLKELNVTQSDIDEIVNIALSVKDDVLGINKKNEQEEEEKKSTVFERIGGESALDAFVEIFYKKILADDTINHFFKNTDINQQKNHQKRFLMFAFGGSNKYNGRTIFAAHKTARDQGLNEDHFNAVAGHLVATLKELNVTQSDIDEIVQIALSVKDHVLGINKK